MGHWFLSCEVLFIIIFISNYCIILTFCNITIWLDYIFYSESPYSFLYFCLNFVCVLPTMLPSFQFFLLLMSYIHKHFTDFIYPLKTDSSLELAYLCLFALGTLLAITAHTSKLINWIEKENDNVLNAHAVYRSVEDMNK